MLYTVSDFSFITCLYALGGAPLFGGDRPITFVPILFISGPLLMLSTHCI